MTSFFDPSRPRLGNGKPCWLGTNIALPALLIYPVSGIMTVLEIEVALPTGPNSFHWVFAQVVPQELEMLTYDWQGDPEAALKHWFKAEPPSSIIMHPREPSAPVMVLDGSPEDFGL